LLIYFCIIWVIVARNYHYTSTLYWKKTITDENDNLQTGEVPHLFNFCSAPLTKPPQNHKLIKSTVIDSKRDNCATEKQHKQ